MTTKVRREKAGRNRKVLLFETLENRCLLSAWSPTNVQYAIDDHNVVVAPAPRPRQVTIYPTNISSTSSGVSTDGQFTDNLKATASIRGSSMIVGKLISTSRTAESSVQAVDAEGQIAGGADLTKNEATQAYASSQFYVQGKGIGVFSITVGAHTEYQHVWASGSSSETTSQISDASTTIRITVVGNFTISVLALAGHEQMDFTLSDSEGYDYARTGRATANISVSVQTTGTYSISAIGSSKCTTVWADSYGSSGGGDNAFSSAALNIHSTGKRGNLMFSAVANRSDVSGYVDGDGEWAKLTEYGAHSGTSTDSRQATSKGRLDAHAKYDTEDDFHSLQLPRHGVMRISPSASASYAPPADVQRARDEIWADAGFLTDTLFRYDF